MVAISVLIQLIICCYKKTYHCLKVMKWLHSQLYAGLICLVTIINKYGVLCMLWLHT